MAHSASKPEWILLIHQLPPKPTNLRVRIWRKLQKLGAVAIKNSVYVLPFNDKTFEDFQWLRQEIESTGGEAAVFRAGAIEGTTDEEIIAAFRRARDEEYTLVTAELGGLTGAISEMKRGSHRSSGRGGGYETELDKLHKELERIVATDFFDAPGRPAAVAAFERCQAALRATQSRSRSPAKRESPTGAALDFAQCQGRRWVTRRNLFVDRLASIWLIKRFIDRRPRFYFVADGETVESGIRFDMYEAEFTHRGEDCTFETMIKEFGLAGDGGLQALAEIVHDIDLKDNKFNRLEAPGLGTVIRGLADLLQDDRKLIRHCDPIFDALYESFTQKPGHRVKGKRHERQARNRADSKNR